MDDALFWKAETACRAAWPAAHERLLDGWIVRQAGGTTRRTNSANPTAAAVSVAAVRPAIERLFEERGQDPLFRVPGFLPAFEEELAEAGFVAEGETCTLLASLEERPDYRASGVTLERSVSPEWLAAKRRLSPMEPEQARIYSAMVDGLTLPRAFASLDRDGGIAAVAYGVVADDLLVIESVVTDPAHRGEGLGRACVGRLLGWALDEGVERACLQVEAENAPARALYRRLGFTRDLYRYRYWRKPRRA
ncbi:MAG: GNAT family N-acetyltransferase [Parvibaculaceae bacterium]